MPEDPVSHFYEASVMQKHMPKQMNERTHGQLDEHASTEFKQAGE